MKNTSTTKSNLRSVVLTLTLATLLQACDSSSSGSGSSGSNQANSCQARTMAASFDKDSVQYNDDLFQDVNNFSVRAQSGNNDQDDSQTRVVKIDVEKFKQRLLNRTSNKFHLPLTSGKSVTINLDEVKKYSENNIVATGRVDNDELSNVTFVINDDVMTANVGETSAEQNYEIRFSGNGVHTVKAVTQDHGDDCETVPGENAENFVKPLDTEAAEDVSALAATPVIDVLVAYTPAALKNAGSAAAMKSLIQMGIADSNKAYQSSGVNLSLRLVGTMALTQNESSFSSDLSALKGTSDGKWDTVHAERKRVGADLVSLVAYYANSSTAGIGYVGSSYSSGFSITKTTAFKQFSFTHELGHNIGLNHTDGLENSAGKFRTVMAYGSYTRIPRFSNPATDYNGYNTGTSSQNSAKILNTRGANVAAFSTSVTQTDNPTNSDPITGLPGEPCTDTVTAPPAASE